MPLSSQLPGTAAGSWRLYLFWAFFPGLGFVDLQCLTIQLLAIAISDRFGGFAWWDPGTATLSASGSGLGAIALDLPPDDPPGVPQPTDLALGTDDVLYVARNDAVVLLDRRDRWPAAGVAVAGMLRDLLARNGSPARTTAAR